MHRLLFIIILLTACTTTPAPSPVAPTATLRSLPTQALISTRSAQSSTAIIPPPPPTPTLSPAASPTPVVYVVQSGDTLIGIAVRFGVTLEALESVNAGIDPGNLQPEQTLNIPPGAVDSLAPVPALTLAPLSVTANPFTCYPTPAASLICLSEFVNTAGQPIVNLAVQATLVNQDGKPGPSGMAYSPLDLIPPGAAVPLAVVFNAPAEGNTANALVTQADSGLGLADRFVSVTVNDVSGSPAQGGLTLSGTLVNPASTELRSIVVIATVYNALGSVTGYRKTVLAEPLAANASAMFSIILPGSSEAGRWTVIAQGRTR